MTTPVPWHHIHTSCKVCGGTDRKHYSGGTCTRCYTLKARAEGRAWAQAKDGGVSKRERLEKKIHKLEVELAQAQQEMLAFKDGAEAWLDHEEEIAA